MLSLRKPSVVFDWVPPPQPPAPDPTRLDIAGFVGLAARGPLNEPVRLQAWSDFCANFGEQTSQGWLGHAVNGFFANGGQACWVVRVADPHLAKPASLAIAPAQPHDNPGGGGRSPILILKARTPGTWGRGIRASLVFRSTELFDLSLALDGELKETWYGLTLNREPDAAAVVNQNSGLVRAIRKGRRSSSAGFGFATTALSGAEAMGSDWSVERDALMQGGSDGLAPQADLIVADGVGFRFLQTASEAHVHVSLRSDALSIVADHLTEGPYPVDPAQPELAAGDINDPLTGSKFVRVEVLRQFTRKVATAPSSVELKGGLTPEMLMGVDRSGAPLHDGRPTGLLALETIKEIGGVAIPDLMNKPANTPCSFSPDDGPDRLAMTPPRFTFGDITWAQGVLLDHCRRKGDRFAILDAPFDGREHFGSGNGDADDYPDLPQLVARDGATDKSGDNAEVERVQAWVEELPDSGRDFGAVYFPWLKIADPAGPDFDPLCVPPSGHVAGAFARCDLSFGLRHAPANLQVEAALDVAAEVDDKVFGNLNIAGVNVLHAAHGRGIRIGGARTLARHRSPALQCDAPGKDADDVGAQLIEDLGSLPDSILGGGRVRYVSIRRLLLLLVRLLDRELQWTVFEPSDRRLWGDIERVIRGVLRGLWRQGALDGASEDQAYFVRCDDSTNPPEQVDNGMVVCILGVQLPSPAEFIVVRIGKTDAATRILD